MIEPRFFGIHCWRTWFIEECEIAGLFGMAERHLPWLRERCRVGLKVYFEDAPYHECVDPKVHRLSGPYEVVPAKVPPKAVPEVTILEQVVVYREPHPELGPWFDRRNVQRLIDSKVVRFHQDAKRFQWFPYRFGIRRCPDFKQFVVNHGTECHAFCKQ